MVDAMLHERIDIRCGAKSDPFQLAEKDKEYTKKCVDLFNQYDCNIVFCTKSDNYYDVPVNPEYHSFQFSVTNHYNDSFLEPNVPEFSKRVKFYNKLKDEGFKVGLRFEPFIPNVTDVIKCLDYFDDPDVVHINKLALLPQRDNSHIIDYIGCNRKDFITNGKTYMKLDVMYTYYLKEVLDYLEEHGYKYSTRAACFGNQECCCGDELVHKCNTHDPVHLWRKYGEHYTLEQALHEMGDYKSCNMRNLFTSNRRGNCHTCEDFYRDRWDKPRTKFNPRNQFKPMDERNSLDYLFKEDNKWEKKKT